MLWLCLSLPQLPLEALHAGEAQRPMIVTACEGSTRWIVCCNRAAELEHLHAPMNYTVALAVCPRVAVFNRHIQAERTALERLAGWAYQFSSTVILGEISVEPNEARNAVLWLEIGASLKLFGGFRRLVETLENELQALSYTYRIGVAPTLEGAALLARAQMRVAATTPQALHARIRDLPIRHLALPHQICQHLFTSGIRTIGLLLELPREAVAKRFGPQMSNYLDRLVGQAPDPRVNYELPARYDARFEFDFELKNNEALLFPLKRMVGELVGFLRGQDLCLQHFHVSLEHREGAATHLHIGLSMPDRDPEKLLTLIREQLARTELPAPAIGLRLLADRFSAPSAQQSDLFSHALQHGEDLAHTMDRITARLGEHAVYGLKSIADHRPEASWSAAALDEKRRSVDFPDRPLWLLPEPKPLQLSSMPRIVSGPERIESGWWDSSDVQRDYYIVHASNGADLWVYRDLARNGEWYLHGFWS